MRYVFLVVIFTVSYIHAQDKVKTLGDLPTEVSETSGLIFYNGRIITHNDSGNQPKLFEIDTTNQKITRTVTLTNVVNTDWEAITQDDDYIYIGDFGNNLGSRKDLKVYRIAKTNYKASDRVAAETINFSYPEQVDFTNRNNNDWDAEAFFVLNDELVVLTKQRKTRKTVAYSFSKNPGTYKAKMSGTYDIAGLVTDATYNTATGKLYILGYNQLLLPFVVQVSGVTNKNIFAGSATKHAFDIGFTQAEGLTHVSDNRYFFSCEFFSNSNPAITSKARLFSFNTMDAFLR